MRKKPTACKTVDELEIGDEFAVDYSVTDEDLVRFAEISGDWNPVHFDDDYAASSIFRERIAHGMISLAKFSGIFGMHLPGLGTLWETQEVNFMAPVYLNRPYKAVARVVDKDKRRAALVTHVADADGKRVLEGKAWVIPITEMQRRKTP